MARLEPAGERVRLQLAREEVDVLVSLAEGLARRLADVDGREEDEVLRRLAPEVSRGDAEVDAELRAMLRPDLLSSRAARLHDLAALLRPGNEPRDDGLDRLLERDEAMRTVEALNDLRIALAATIGYETIERDDLAADDPREDAVRLMDALAWLQGGLIEFVDRSD
jgi:hypothetical protein